MRLTSTLLALFLALIPACGGDDGGGDGDGDGDGGGGIDATSSPDAPVNQPDADNTLPDARVNLPDAAAAVGVTCGADTCYPPDEVCCADQQTQVCQAPGDCGGAEVSCDGPEDCGDGEVCCASGGQGGGQVSCTPDQCQLVVCHTEADCPNQGDMCCATPFGGSVCSSFCI